MLRLDQFLKGKKFEDVTKEDLIRYFGFLENGWGKESVYRSYKRGSITVIQWRIKSFFKWLENEEAVDWIKLKLDRMNLPRVMTGDEALRSCGRRLRLCSSWPSQY